jgi:hypothetical protein
MQAWESWSSVTSPSVLGKGKACGSGITPRRTLSKQSLWGYMSVKLTPEICINKASSNSRLTEMGRWATATDSHSQNSLQTFFFSLFLWWDNNRTTTAYWKTYWNCIAFELETLCGFFVFIFVLCCFGLVLFPFGETMIQLLLRHHLQDWRLRDEHQFIKTETLLHLNLEIFYFFFFFIFNPLSVSLMPVQLTVN